MLVTRNVAIFMMCEDREGAPRDPLSKLRMRKRIHRVSWRRRRRRRVWLNATGVRGARLQGSVWRARQIGIRRAGQGIPGIGRAGLRRSGIGCAWVDASRIGRSRTASATGCTTSAAGCSTSAGPARAARGLGQGGECHRATARDDEKSSFGDCIHILRFGFARHFACQVKPGHFRGQCRRFI
jgi:hypothetical protein